MDLPRSRPRSASESSQPKPELASEPHPSTADSGVDSATMMVSEMGTIEQAAAEQMERGRRLALISLLLLVPAPSLGVASEMIWFPGFIGLCILGASKFWIFGFPAAWAFFAEESALARPRPNSRGLMLGLTSGLLGATVVVLGFHFVLRERIDTTLIREMARKNHLLAPALYLAVAVYICAFNSLLEEYVWRWFVYGRFEKLVPRGWAVFLAAAAFTLHHSIILASQFGAEMCLIGSLAVFVAGLTWSWIYAKTRSIWSAWLSHALIDIAVFWAGWQLLFVG